MSVDIRSRVDGEVEAVDPARCFGELLPDRVRAAARPVGATRCACSRPRRSCSRSTATRGRSPTTTAPSGCAPVAPTTPTTVLRLSAAQLNDLVTDQVTVVGHADQRIARPTRRALRRVARLVAPAPWRARRACTPRARRDRPRRRDGAPLALDRSFAADAPLDEMGDFLQRAGYLHIDGRVHRGRDGRGVASTWIAPRRCTRATTAGRGGRATPSRRASSSCACSTSTRCRPPSSAWCTTTGLQRLAGLTGDGHVYGSMEDNRIEALFKPFGVVEGISDLPWHKDCALGRHSYDCCSMTVGHLGDRRRRGVGPAARGRGLAPCADVAVAITASTGPTCPAVDLPTRTGDVTVHLSCTLHKSQPPVERERRVLYTGFRLPIARHRRRARSASNGCAPIREDAPVKAPSANRA